MKAKQASSTHRWKLLMDAFVILTESQMGQYVGICTVPDTGEEVWLY